MNRRHFLLAAPTAVLACPATVAAARAPRDGVELGARALLEETTQADGSGAAMRVGRGAETLFRGARGLADIELDVPLSPDQTFRIASITKSFTAALVVKLAEEGRLSLEDTLAVHLPDFPNAGGITIRQLLNHTAGVSDIVGTPIPGFFRRDNPTGALVEQIRARPPVFAPGARMAYSNAGYVLLGAVIEAVAGKPWHVSLDERLLQPLGLRRTRYGTDGPIVPGRVSGYTRLPDGTVANAGYINVSGPAAAGALESTVDDLDLWMRALGSGAVVSREGWREMTTPPVLPDGTTSIYGFGLFVWRLRGLKMVGHTGQIDGFASIAAYVPERDLTVVVLANNDRFDARVTGRRLAAVGIGDPYPRVVAQPLNEDLGRALPGVYGSGASQRTLSVAGGVLSAQRPGRDPIPLQVSSDGDLHFIPDEISYFRPVRNRRGRVTALDYFQDGEGPPVRLARAE